MLVPLAGTGDELKGHDPLVRSVYGKNEVPVHVGPRAVGVIEVLGVEVDVGPVVGGASVLPDADGLRRRLVIFPALLFLRGLALDAHDLVYLPSPRFVKLLVIRGPEGPPCGLVVPVSEVDERHVGDDARGIPAVTVLAEPVYLGVIGYSGGNLHDSLGAH